jgi:hypothetical protein
MALKKALDDWEQVNAELVQKIGAEQARDEGAASTRDGAAIGELGEGLGQ